MVAYLTFRTHNLKVFTPGPTILSFQTGSTPLLLPTINGSIRLQEPVQKIMIMLQWSTHEPRFANCHTLKSYWDHGRRASWIRLCTQERIQSFRLAYYACGLLPPRSRPMRSVGLAMKS